MHFFQKNVSHSVIQINLNCQNIWKLACKKDLNGQRFTTEYNESFLDESIDVYLMYY